VVRIVNVSSGSSSGASFGPYHRSHKPEYVIGLSVPTVIATFAVAYLAHRYVEKPFLRLRDRNREAPATTSAAA
jgi:peptidoglycan/LPS O-acetylase OafA/YrhL